MILSDRELRALLQQGELTLVPFEDELIQPSSIDLRLHAFTRSIEPSPEVFDLAQDVLESELYRDVEIGHEGLILGPGDTLLGQTAETMRLPATCQGMIAQRSSLVRIGIHVSSSLINPGYDGNLPLMIRNCSRRPLRIHAGTPICQLVLFRLSSRPDAIYPEKPDAKYQGERRITPSRVAEDVRRWVRPPVLHLADPTQAEAFRKEPIFEDDSDEIL